MMPTPLATLVGLLSLGLARSTGVRELIAQDFTGDLEWWKYRDTVPDDEDSYMFALFYDPKHVGSLQIKDDWHRMGMTFNHAKGNLLIAQIDCSVPEHIDICHNWYKVNPPDELVDDGTTDDVDHFDSRTGWSPYPTLVWWNEKMWNARKTKASKEANYNPGEKYLPEKSRVGGGHKLTEKFLIPEFHTLKAFAKKYLEGLERNCDVAKKEACNVEEVKAKDKITWSKPVEVLSKDGCCLPGELTFLTEVGGLDATKLEAKRNTVKGLLEKEVMTPKIRHEKEMQRKLLSVLIKKHKKDSKKGKKEL